MVAHPLGELPLGKIARSQLMHSCHHLRAFDLELEPIDVEKCGRGDEPDPFVAVDVWMPAGQGVAVNSRQYRQVSRPVVVPSMGWPRQGRLQHVLVTNTWQTAVLDQLVVMKHVDGDASQPARFGQGRWRAGELVRQLAERRPVPLGDSSSGFYSPKRLFVVRRQQNAVRRFHSEDVVARPDVETVRHVFGESGAD